MSYTSAKGFADILARYLANPEQPGLCPICFSELALRFSCDFVGHFPRLRIECHALFDSCIAAITRHRTVEELAQLQHDLMNNHSQCDLHDGPDDLRYPLDPALYLRALFDGAGSVILTAAEFGDCSLASRAVRAHKSFADKRGRWPVRVEQLFPYGAEAAVDAVLAYCELYISAAPMNTLSSLLVAARPAIIPLLSSDRFRARLADVVMKMVDPVASGIANVPLLLGDQSMFASICHFISTVMIGPGALPQDRAQLFAGHEPALLRVLGGVIQRLDEGHPLLPGFCVWSADIAHRLNLAVPRCVRLWLREAGELPEHRTRAARILYEFISRRMASRLCWGPGCTHSSITSEGGKPFPSCARCKVPRYCSRACQRSDWKNGAAPAPHVRACSVLEKVGAHACHRLSAEQFADAYARAEPLFDETDKAAIASFTTFWLNC